MLKFDINTSKNLLAFSGGIDSTALFFLLLEENIPFDIAIVNYNMRTQSKDEVAYAENLASKYHKKCFLKEVIVENQSNFEKKARDIRYSFFDDIIKKHNYETLITAHQLNDKLEWFLMQLTKGAGLAELIGLEKYSLRNNYQIYKPLLEFSKERLLKYLDKNSISYFIDDTNDDEKYKRNFFRKNFANDLIKEYEKGIINSFNYMKKDLNSLNIETQTIYENKELEIFKNLNDDNLNIKLIDKSLKKRGVLVSKAQRDEITKQKQITISNRVNISIEENYIFISPKSEANMNKEFKEKCRLKKIPKNIRAYMFENSIEPRDLMI